MSTTPNDKPGPDIVGWISLAVALPGFCLVAPLVLGVTIWRVVRLTREGRDVPWPTSLALFISGGVSLFLVWYFWRVTQGAYP